MIDEKNLPYFFPLFFIAICFVLSRMGWSRLASKYKSTQDFYGPKIGWISAGVNKVYYKSCLVLKYNSEGLYLRPIVLFRLFHDPIAIPWNEIKEVQTKMFGTKVLVIGNPLVAKLTISSSTFNKFQHELNYQH